MDESDICESLFGDDSEDDFVPPTSDDDSDDKINDIAANLRRRRRLFEASARLERTARIERLRLENSDEPSSAGVKRTRGAEAPNTPSTLEEQDDPRPLPDNDLEVGLVDTPKKKPRKVVSNPETWKSNIRKKNHQSGKAYVSRRGKAVPEKLVRSLKNCVKCMFKCSNKISVTEQNELHESYYSLKGSTEKRHFLISTTERMLTARPKRCENKKKRTFTFKYYFNIKGERIQVCKQFYLGTLSISQKPVYTVHNTKDMKTNTPQSDKKGKSKTSRRTPTGNVESVHEHIHSFPKIESHYCRAQTKREYLGSNLSISKMFDLYKEYCIEHQVVPVKKSMYHRIFVTHYNLGFHQPKSDRCDSCEIHKMAEKTGAVDEKAQNEYNYHITEKTCMRENAKHDKESDTPVLMFDLENVITCPRAAISSFFYSRKLNVYNMTAYMDLTKQVYCAIWTEKQAGRAGNDIASAVRRILDVVAEENDLTKLITWSDSCVPQNRNSIMAYAILDFLKENKQIEEIEMKYSVPGHSCVQMVDNAHSTIEKAMEETEFYSPVGFVRILKQANRKNPFRVIQMKESDFKDFGSIAKMLDYKQIPFSKVTNLKFTQILHEVEFKTSHCPYVPMKNVNLKIEARASQRKNQKKKKEEGMKIEPVDVISLKPKVENTKIELSQDKRKDIMKMYPLMPLQDREYFKAILG